MSKRKNLQPWLDYFEVLQSYEGNGYLEVDAEKHEAYVTLPALLTLAGFDDEAIHKLAAMARSTRAVVSVLRNIRTYAGWKSQHGGDYLAHGFALHVVKDDTPHDLLYTLVITSRRRWWKLWMWSDSIEVIEYATKGKDYDRT